MPPRFNSGMFVPLKIHLEELFNVRLRALTDLIAQARDDMERRMEGFPNQFVKKGDIEAEFAVLAKEVKDLNEFKNLMEGKASRNSVIITMVISIIAILIALAGMMRHFQV